MSDHDNDTDDLMVDTSLLALRDHDNDTDDIPDGLDPSNAIMLQRDTDGGWVTYMEKTKRDQLKQQETERWESLYKDEEAEQSYEFVQTQYHENDTDDLADGQEPFAVQMQFDHENDTDDMPLDQDPYMVQLQDHENDTDDIPAGQDPFLVQIDDSRFNGRSIGELVQIRDADDDEFDGSDVVLMRYTVSHHENDTDDIDIELNPTGDDPHHSKMWNQQVQKQAQELENTMRLQEQMARSKEQAKLEAIRRQAEFKANEAAAKAKLEAI